VCPNKQVVFGVEQIELFMQYSKLRFSR
jgi:hypothetical protein